MSTWEFPPFLKSVKLYISNELQYVFDARFHSEHDVFLINLSEFGNIIVTSQSDLGKFAGSRKNSEF